MSSVQDRVRQLIADQLRQPLEKVTNEAHLIDDLDADSLDIVDLTIAIEETFSTDDNMIEIPEEDAAEIRTVQALLDYLAAHGIA
jgi:acyl carrier protein